MERFWLIVREISWLAVFSVAAVIASVVTLIVAPDYSLGLGVVATALAVLSNKA
jgi:hypothetical protein